MNGIIGKFDGVPIRLCKCGAEPEIYIAWNNLAIYCLKCGCCVDVHIDPATPDFEPGFYEIKDIIECWNSEMEVSE